MRRKPYFMITLLMPVVFLIGLYFFGPAEAAEKTALKVGIPKKAGADLESKNGSTVKGHITFVETTRGLDIQYELSGLVKNEKHGFHIHEKGDCSSADAKSAGTHYKEVAPTGGTSLDTPHKYAGDLPMITADAEGNAKGTVRVSQLSLDKANPVVGRAIIVHGGPDDISKKSAPRFACGVIKNETTKE